MVDENVIRTADERAMRRLVRQGARILAEYNWQGSGVAELEARGRERIVQLPKPQMGFRSVRTVADAVGFHHLLRIIESTKRLPRAR